MWSIRHVAVAIAACFTCVCAARAQEAKEPSESQLRADVCLALLPIAFDENIDFRIRMATHLTVRSLWDKTTQEAVVRAMTKARGDERRLLVEGLALLSAPGDRDAHEGLMQVLGEDDPAVLRAIYLAMGRIGAGGAADTLVSALAFDDGKDKLLHDALIQAIDATGKAGVEKLLALADSGSDADLARVLETYPRLHSRAAGEGLITLVRNYHATPAQKASLIRLYSSHAQLDPPLSLQPLADFFAKLPMPKKSAGAKEAKEQGELVPVFLAALEILAPAKKVAPAVLRETLAGIIEIGETDRLAQIARQLGEPDAGRAIYFENKAVSCTACHALDGAGGKTAPDLTRIGTTHSTAKALEVLLKPGAKGKESPHDVARHLSFTDILDLAAFLRDPAFKGSLRGKARQYLVVGPFEGSFDTALGPETDSDPARWYEARTGRAATDTTGEPWLLKETDSSGLLKPLGPQHVQAKTSAYAMTFLYSPRDQDALLEVAGPAVARYWVNGKRILDFAPCCDAPPARIALQQGWNRILVRVFATQEEMAFSLRISGAGGLRFSAREE